MARKKQVFKQATKKPSMKNRKLLAPLIELCTKLISTCSVRDTQDPNYKLVCVDIVESKDNPLPKGFPQGKPVGRAEDGRVKYRYDVRRILAWCKKNLYITYDGGDILKQRLIIFSKLNYLERSLNKLVDIDGLEEYNDGIE